MNSLIMGTILKGGFCDGHPEVALSPGNAAI